MQMELAQDHDGLRKMMRDFAHAMESARVEDMSDIARRRIAFSQLFREHMAREDAMVQNLRRGAMPPQADRIIRDHSRAMVALFLRYSDHIKYWTPAQIAADWPGYRVAVLDLQNGLHDRMEWEEANLHPLLIDTPRKAA
ncbi:hemerythrin domain-containing protein [Sphingobium sp.]|uniref:hemerythrin domain-containing protein n=1 Tax=Sphingobium sp. TaxID=1912891 RepID=UPI00261E0D1A|nr:hemerythrin domain-containing protein [Sphingobium sp.]